MRRLPLLFLIVTGLLVAGCGAGYLAHTAAGQAQVLLQREPLDRLLARPELDPALRSSLETAREIRDFASQELGLPDNASYRTYTALDRPHAMWVVSAAPRHSVEPREWCYPVAGCVTYRGYFARERAQVTAARLRASGFDVDLYGVSAYSTLGWFADPLFNTMLGNDETVLAELIFHELAHQQVYAPGDTAFNEAFATVVGETGVRRWLYAQDRADALAAWESRREWRVAVATLALEYRERLRLVYAQTADYDALEAMRAEHFAALREELIRWGAFHDSTELNNAWLTRFYAYRGLVPAFEGLLDAHQGDLTAFYRAVEDLAAESRAQRHASLREHLPADG